MSAARACRSCRCADQDQTADNVSSNNNNSNNNNAFVGLRARRVEANGTMAIRFRAQRVSGIDALHDAARSRNPERIAHLVHEVRVDVNRIYGKSAEPPIVAVLSRMRRCTPGEASDDAVAALACVQILLSVTGIDVNKHDSSGITALMYATYARHLGVIELLLDAPGIDVGITDDIGNDALQIACSSDFSECIDAIAERADASTLLPFQFTPRVAAFVDARRRWQGRSCVIAWIVSVSRRGFGASTLR